MVIGILGGGLTGLSLAYFLDDIGVEFELLEARQDVGGLMRSHTENGYTFDRGGSHILFSRNAKTLQFMLGLLGDNIVRNTRDTRILFEGLYVKYPFECGLRDLPLDDNFECVHEFIKSALNPHLCPSQGAKPNLMSWCKATFGEGIADRYLIPYNRKVWKRRLEEIGTEWVERIPRPSIEDILKSSLGYAIEGYTHQLNFYYPRVGGIQSLVEAMSQPTADRTETGFEVARIRRKGGHWIVSDGRREREYTQVVSTIHPNSLLEALGATNGSAGINGRGLEHNSLITVAVGLNSPSTSKLSWLYVPDPEVLPHRVSYPCNYSPRVAPFGKSSILAEVTCVPGSALWKKSDSQISRRVVKDLSALGLISRSDVDFVRVFREDKAYVVNTIESVRHMNSIRDYLRRRRLRSIGRWGNFEYLNMDECIERSREEATALSAGDA